MPETKRRFTFCPSYDRCPVCGHMNKDILKWTAANGKDVTENTTTTHPFQDNDQ